MVIEVQFPPNEVLEVDLDDDDDEADPSVGDELAHALVCSTGIDDAETHVRRVAVAAGLRVNARRRNGAVRLLLRRRVARSDTSAWPT